MQVNPKIDIVAVVVWYNPTEEQAKNILSYIHEVYRVIIVDNSTASNSSEVSRGAGLGAIEQFVKENRGVMMLVSGSCCYVVNGSTSSYIRLPNSVKGTFFSMKINVDREHLYE